MGEEFSRASRLVSIAMWISRSHSILNFSR